MSKRAREEEEARNEQTNGIGHSEAEQDEDAGMDVENSLDGVNGTKAGEAGGSETNEASHEEEGENGEKGDESGAGQGGEGVGSPQDCSSAFVHGHLKSPTLSCHRDQRAPEAKETPLHLRKKRRASFNSELWSTTDPESP